MRRRLREETREQFSLHLPTEDLVQTCEVSGNKEKKQNKNARVHLG